MLIRKPSDIPGSEITPETIYKQRRKFMGKSAALLAGSALARSAAKACCTSVGM